MILYEWIPTGPIISCIGCGKTFNENRGKSGLRKGADVKIKQIIFTLHLIKFKTQKIKNKNKLNIQIYIQFNYN